MVPPPHFLPQIDALGPIALGPIALGPITLGPIALGPIALGPIALGPIAPASRRRPRSPPPPRLSPRRRRCAAISGSLAARPARFLFLFDYLLFFSFSIICIVIIFVLT